MTTSSRDFSRTCDPPKKPMVKTETLGCRLNISESAAMKKLAESHMDGDVIIVNTCAVTGEAERQSRQRVRKMCRTYPDAKVIVTGCSAQLHPKTYADMPGVDRVLGNHEKMQARFYKPNMHDKMYVQDIMKVQESTPHLVNAFDQQVRAFIEIQNGCDHRCTFCTIPFGRGNNRSVPMGTLVDHVKAILEGPVQEIVLTGVDITGYGTDLPGKPRLGDMVKRLLTQVPKLRRLRLSSVDPSEIDETLMDLLCYDERLLPHVHLSFQSGDPMILKRMKRRHTPKDAVTLCQHLRARRPEVLFGADIIAGFPTETQSMFENTLQCLQDCDVTFGHIFPFSPRQGTPAARMPQVPGPLIKERAKILRDWCHHQKEKVFSSLLHSVKDVLIEENGKGYTDTFVPVNVRDGERFKGQKVRVAINDYDETSLFGSCV